MKRLLPLLLVGMVFGATPLYSQVTTAALTGHIGDEHGMSLPGATVVATHISSGTVYGVISRDDGSYTIPNMRVGGPYTLEVSFIGYESDIQENIFLKLGEKLRKDATLKESVTQLGEI